MTKMLNPSMQNQMMRAQTPNYMATTAAQGQQQMQPQVMPQSYQYTPAAAPQMPNMQYGLQGSEAALGSGYQQALSGVQGGVDMARQALLGSTGMGVNTGLAGQQMYGNQAINALQGAQGYNQLLGNKAVNTIGAANRQQQQYGNQALGGINSALGMQQQYGNQALGAIKNAVGSASGAINKGITGVNSAFNEGVSALNQYIPQGTNAFNLMANFSGSGPGGAAAQQQAYDSYMEGPDVAFLREQGERSVLQNARAAGGVGGNVLKELQRYGTGVASQGFNDYYNRLKGVADMGFGASQGVGSLRGQQAGIVGNLSAQQAQNAMQGGQLASNVYGDLGSGAIQGAQLSSNVLGNMGSNTMQNANAAANIYGNLGSNYSNTAGQMSNVYGDLGAGSMNASNNLANIYNNAGLSAGDYAYGTGQLLSGGRLQAGRDISAIQQAQGQGLSNIVGGGASNIAQLLSGVGDTINSQQGNLASLLANLATNSASTAGNQTSVAQFMKSPDYVNQLSQVLGAGGAAYQYGR
jgi:hypothetical protein